MGKDKCITQMGICSMKGIGLKVFLMDLEYYVIIK